MEEIFNYSDYRKFLKDYYESNKSRNPAFSYRYLSMRAGINSAPFYKWIMEGTRNLTKSTIMKTCLALKLKDREAEYFEDLVFFNQAKSVKEKNVFFDKLIALQKARNVKKITPDQYDYFSQWYHCAVRELVTFPEFNDDFQWLAKKLNPPINAEQARHSVNLLLQLGFIKKEASGRYIQTEPVVSTGHGIKAHQVVQFQIAMLRLAIDAYDRAKGEEGLMSSTTFGISKDSFELFKKKIRELRSQLLEIARADEKPEHVYQLAINFFPLSRKGE
jgi:uncharacterized protein (TIGR02147 family)